MRIRDLMAKGGEAAGPDTLHIIAYALSMRKEEVLARMGTEIGDETARTIEGLFEERGKGKPLAYITGEKEFYSHSFSVDGRVLIPRPETELLVEEALAILDKGLAGLVMDMGTGSGIIGNTIARSSSRSVLCVDVSREALAVARKNGQGSAVSDKLSFLCSDLFGAMKRGVRFAMILANLPYVSEAEWEDVMTDVKAFEPALALLGGADGLAVYRRFVEGLPQYLERGGYALCEIGSAAQAGEMTELLTAHGFTVTVKNDLAGRERVVIGRWTNS